MLLFLLCVAGTAFVCQLPQITIDYGFWGCMLPVFASLFDFRGIEMATPPHENWLKLDVLPVRVLCMGVGILMLCLTKNAMGSILFYALLTIPLLLLYNGEKGKCNTKYFFYLFYPLHLVLLEGIYMLLYQI